MSLTFKWTILVTDALFSFKINLITMTDRSMKIKSLVWLWTLCTGWICKWFSMALRFRWRSRYIWVKKLKIIIIKFYKIVKILRAPWLVKINCYRGQVSKETLVLHRWESIAGNKVKCLRLGPKKTRLRFLSLCSATSSQLHFLKYIIFLCLSFYRY